MEGCSRSATISSEPERTSERTNVRGHDDDGVLEVDDPAVRVGQAAVVEHLQEELMELASSLFNPVRGKN
jgi:hypothetical protein